MQIVDVVWYVNNIVYRNNIVYVNSYVDLKYEQSILILLVVRENVESRLQEYKIITRKIKDIKFNVVRQYANINGSRRK